LGKIFLIDDHLLINTTKLGGKKKNPKKFHIGRSVNTAFPAPTPKHAKLEGREIENYIL